MESLDRSSRPFQGQQKCILGTLRIFGADHDQAKRCLAAMIVVLSAGTGHACGKRSRQPQSKQTFGRRSPRRAVIASRVLLRSKQSQPQRTLPAFIAVLDSA